MRQDGTATFTTGPAPAIMKPRWPRMRFISGIGTSMPASRFTSVSGKSITRSSPNVLPTTTFSDGVPPHISITSLVASLEPRHHEGGIDAALEAIARIRIDAELAAGLRDVDLVPQRRFDQHVGGLFRAAGGLAAHDAGERFDAMVVRDHANAAVERVGAAVERQQRLAVARAAHGEIALHFGGVEHMQRPGAVVGHEVGDIDQRVDRPQADRGQALLQPFRRRAVLDAAHQPQRESRTQRWRPRP